MTRFTEFIRNATPEQKAVVYTEVMRQVAQMQEATIKAAREFTESRESSPGVNEPEKP